MLRLSELRLDERLQLGSMKIQRCAACGAELRLRPTRCPLCGAEPSAPARPPKKRSTESYQSDVRKLRAQLKKLRDEGAEAV